MSVFIPSLGAAYAAHIWASKPDMKNVFFSNVSEKNEQVVEQNESSQITEVFHRAPDLLYEKPFECELGTNNDIQLTSQGFSSNLCVDYSKYWSEGTQLIVKDAFERSQESLEEVYPKLKEISVGQPLNIHMVDSIVFALHELAENVGRADNFKNLKNIALTARELKQNSLFMGGKHGAYDVFIEPIALDLLKNEKLTQDNIDSVRRSIELELLKNYAGILAEKKSGLGLETPDGRLMNAVINLEMLTALNEKYKSIKNESSFAQTMSQNLPKIKSQAKKDLKKLVNFHRQVKRATRPSERERWLKVLNRRDIREI